jgi:hypothetical protein
MSGKLQEVLDKLQKANNTIAEQRKEIERLKALAIKRIVEGTPRELSDEEIMECFKEVNLFTVNMVDVARAILKKASEK